MTSYRMPNATTSSCVTYRAKGNDGAIIKTWANQPCFSEIFCPTYVPNGTIMMEVVKPKNRVPYEPPAIMAFMLELKKMGFPVYCEAAKEDIILGVYVKKCISSLDFKASLTLTRCLWEDAISHVADNFLQLIDNNPSDDRFLLLQRVHRETPYAICVHSACTGRNPVGHKLFWERVARAPEISAGMRIELQEAFTL